MGRISINLSIKNLTLLVSWFYVSCMLLNAQDKTLDLSNRDCIIKYSIDVVSKNVRMPKAKFYHITYCDTAFYVQSAGEGLWDATIYDEMFVISFFGQDDYKYLDDMNLPNSYYRKKDALYVWDNPDRGANLELEKQLRAAGRIVSTEGMTEQEVWDILDSITSFSDKAKGVYLFCSRDNPRKHRVIVTNVGLGYYRPPCVICDRKRVHQTRLVNREELKRLQFGR